MSDVLLAVENLTVDIGGTAVVDGVSFAMRRGEVLALVGESGCGKSLTAMALLRLLPPAARLAAGRVVLEGQDLAALPERAMRRLRGEALSIIFQEPTASLDPLATVGSQIVEAYRVHRGVTRAEARRAARDMLDAVGIPDAERRLEQYPFELSGGMCQRIMIAIALVCGPSLLVADEPTTALDVTIQAQILDLMRKLVAERGASILIITHDMGVVADIADRVAVMYAGRVVEVAPVAELFASPRHPYTALLLASVPRLDATPKAQLATIEGRVPSPDEFGVGCRFAGRCPLAVQRCHEAPPALADIGRDHAAACWRSADVARLMEPAS
ncbi:ABC transporter ATP-binding protein [Alsobacter sp. SYSU M60028]|uniref:ABC transporter ATP-binding protein n=1 Tax=Alsobacter ponti TaxID=2962936 RepID=A0ABT1LG30_9HYPH|nr:ABC transporter ATP-binding protein [Alsobacter ponti]MCP8939680.1 ABC transporter ATP-binding protein [Alsobacter ponti]